MERSESKKNVKAVFFTDKTGIKIFVDFIRVARGDPPQTPFNFTEAPKFNWGVESWLLIGEMVILIDIALIKSEENVQKYFKTWMLS